MRRLTMFVCAVLLTAGCNKSSKKVAEEEPKPKAMNAFDRNEGAGGTVIQVANAAKRTVAANDMHQLHLLIETYSSSNGSMPDANTIMEFLKKDAGSLQIAKYIEEGWIILTNTKNREGVWAYEKEALNTTGWVISNNGEERMSAPDLKALLGK